MNHPQRGSQPHRVQASQRPRCPGFTLVELLVVIAIIGVLVGLLLPAVQSAREAARRCSCSNNMAQLGIAAHNYEFAVEHLPPGCKNPTGPILSEPVGQHVGFMVQLLPYIEQSSVYQRFDQKLGVYDPANQAARKNTIQMILCPSSPYERNEDQSSGLTSYAGCHHHVEASIDEDNQGVLFLNSKVRYSDITDGASHTIMFGEMIADESSQGWAAGTRASLRNTGEPGFQARERNGLPIANEDRMAVGGFDSFHQGGAQYCLADGSITFLTDSIDPILYQNMGNRSDGAMMDAYE